ncbi:unnamed protein product [Bursaphelenchus xylophilus]|uniref:Riboflavin transporter n=1 Tax=Bursaphelenchus xylophilus TaxID=6326 RepID=A0A1I7RMY9_BURXY|nr:unnamed protein product [Bursaphelenchus xylophilus]CAG9125338.1 unnamed protein product [Bursaphelenchus xylophilus]
MPRLLDTVFDVKNSLKCKFDHSKEMVEERASKKKINRLTQLCVALFGSVPYVGLNAFLVEQSVHTQVLVEGWSLGAIGSVILQLAAICVVSAALIEFFFLKIKLPRGPIILIVFTLVATSTLILGFCSEYTVVIFGKERSIVVYLTMFIICLPCSMSDVFIIPYMKNLPQMYFLTFFVGIGISALFPMAIALAQGASTYECVASKNDPNDLRPNFDLRFGVTIFYSCICAFQVLGTIAFGLLHYKQDLLNRLWFGDSYLLKETSSTDEMLEKDANLKNICDNRDYIFLGLLGVLTVQVYVFLPSLRSYATLPYSREAYYWALVISCICDPTGGLLAYFFPTKRIRHFMICITIVTIIWLYIIIQSFNSPYPWFVGTLFGSLLAVVLQTAMRIIQFYAVSLLFEAVMEQGKTEPERERRLLYCGFASQFANLCGTAVIYILVNALELFQDLPPC